MRKIIVVIITFIIVFGTLLYFYIRSLNNSEIEASVVLDSYKIQKNVVQEQNIKENKKELKEIIVILNGEEKIIEEIKEKSGIDNILEEIDEQDNSNEEILAEPNTNTIQEITSYYIKVNYQANVATIYTPDENGAYVNPYKAMICSTGTATPSRGTYRLSNKFRWLGLIGNVYGQYCTQITGNILFHSVPYMENGNKASLEYWEYDKLGTSCSAGCVRLTIADAKWIYDNCSNGTIVEFYGSDDPGPLGKPETMKISGYEDYRNWDPTDEDNSNPWLDFSEI